MEGINLNQSDDLYSRMVFAEKELEALNKAISKFKKDLEEEIYNVSTIVDMMRDETINNDK